MLAQRSCFLQQQQQTRSQQQHLHQRSLAGSAHRHAGPRHTLVLASASGGQPVHHQQQAHEAEPQPQQRQQQQQHVAGAVEQLGRSFQSAPAADTAPAPALPNKLRPLFIRTALPVLRTVRVTERRLEADLLTIATTILLVVGLIVWDRGLQSLLDGLLGEGPRGSVFCIVVGLGLVVAARLSGRKVSDIFSA